MTNTFTSLVTFPGLFIFFFFLLVLYRIVSAFLFPLLDSYYFSSSELLSPIYHLSPPPILAISDLL